MSVTRQILVALVLGIIIGLALNTGAELLPAGSVLWLDTYLLTPIGKIFLRLLQFVVVPMVFGALVLSLTSPDANSGVGRHASQLLISYIVTSAVALLIGIGVALWLTPGVGAASLVAQAPSAGG